jgi:energy-converting hydrogenase Eha subunit B
MKTVHTTVREIFAAWPELHGFSVQDAETLTEERASGQLEGRLFLADVATTPYAPAESLLGEIAVALLELIDEQPEAVDELRGRTFARTLH